jgi:hypothetical protein
LGTIRRKKTHTPPKKIETGNIVNKTQKEDTDRTKKDRHGEHWTQDTERRHTLHQKRQTRRTLGTRRRKKTLTPPKKINTGNIGHKTQKEDTNPSKKDRHREHWTQDAERRHGPHQKR